MTIADRIENFNSVLPRSSGSLFELGGRLYGQWFLGNSYGNKGSRLYGAYPGNYLRRVMTLFPEKQKILHLFSGGLPPGNYIRFDRNENADLRGDVHSLASIWHEAGIAKFDLIVGDPPYSEEDAVHYGVPMCNRNLVLKECLQVLEPGGHVVWLDQVWPQYSNRDWKLYGSIGIVISTNHRVRNSFMYEKRV